MRSKLHFSLFVLLLMFFSSCKTNRSLVKEPIKTYGADYLFEKLKENELKFEHITTKFNLDLVIDKKKTSFRGQMRIRRDSALWISFSPALGIEVARLLITQDSVKFINRINKTYFVGDYKMVNKFLGTNVDFDVLQSIVLGNDLTYYDNGKFRATFDSKEYHLVTGGRNKLKKYVRNQDDANRIYIQNIYLNPETFKISHMKIKEMYKESNKLDALYSDFQLLGTQQFAYHIEYHITAAKPILVEMNYTRAELNKQQAFPFRISSKYEQIH